MEHPFTWYSALPYPISALAEHNFTALFVMVVLLLLAVAARRALARSADAIVPEAGLSVRNLMEFLIGLLVLLTDGIIGKKGRKYIPLFGSLLLFLLLANLIGLVPGFSPPTNDFNTTFGLAVVSFVGYNFFGFKEHGKGYIKQFAGPMTSLPSTSGKLGSLLLVPVLLISVVFFFFLEGFSHSFRLVSLAVRLYGNMFGDHQVLEAFLGLTKVVIPVAFYMLGALVSVIQAFVFTILTVIYVALAVSHEH